MAKYAMYVKMPCYAECGKMHQRTWKVSQQNAQGSDKNKLNILG